MKQKVHNCTFAVVFIINILQGLYVTEYVADLLYFGVIF